MSAVVEQSGRPAERRMPWRGMLGSLLLHLAIIALLLGLWQTAPAPELVVPHVAIVIEAPGSEGSSGGGGGGGQGQAEAPAAIAQAEAAPPTAEQTTPTETPATAEPQKMEQPPTAETTPVAPTPDITAPPTPPPPKPQRKPPLPQPPIRIAAAPPPQPQASPPLPEPAPAPAPAATPTPAQTLANAAPAAAGPDTGGPGGPRGAGKGAEGNGLGSAGNSSGPGDDYLDRVRRRLRQFQKYPEQAVKQKQEGTVVLAITVARDGSVLDATVARSSGFALIDEAAVKMARDASPLPPFPATYTQDQRTFDIPQKYEIGLFDRIFR
ncbi:MAG TPA: energy transducer TonB [Stellaceae bacterium]|nr:energy transducer TonB [Stellaceae bacterium]